MPDMICNGKCSHFQNIGYFSLLLLGKLTTPKRAIVKKKVESKIRQLKSYIDFAKMYSI